MRIAELPEHLVIVGSGFVAAEFAHVFSALGVRVTLVIRGGTLLRHLRRHHLRTVHPHRVDQVGTAHAPQRRRRAANRGSGVALELDDGSTAERRPAAGGHRPAVQRRPAGRRAGRSRRRRTAGSWSTNTNGPPRVAFSRSATSRRRISSSTSPTTRPASCSTTCSATGTTPSRWPSPTIASYRRRCSPIPSWPPSG